MSFETESMGFGKEYEGYDKHLVDAMEAEMSPQANHTHLEKFRTFKTSSQLPILSPLIYELSRTKGEISLAGESFLSFAISHHN